MLRGTILDGRSVWVGAILGGVLLLGAAGGGYLWGARGASSAPRPRANEDEAPQGSREPASENPTTRRAFGETLVHASAATAPPTEESDEPSLSPEASRDQEVGRIKASGPDRRNLVVDARRVGRDWSDTVRAKGLAVTFDDWQCYRAGCLVNARHESAKALDQVTDEITHSRGFSHWNGGKFRSGPVPTDEGKTEATWILFAPAEDERALQELL